MTSSTTPTALPLEPKRLRKNRLPPITESPPKQAEQKLYPISSFPYQIPGLTTNEDLAKKLSWTSTKQLCWLSKSKNEHYTILFLKKKGGAAKAKLRKLHNPDSSIRTVQYRVLTRLLDPIPIPEYIYGFEKGKSIPVMAAIHTGKDVVISLDIKDFFPSIKQYMVKALFEALGVKPPASTVLSELCTYTAYVPQGSLTAPKISNLIVAGTFGPTLQKSCEERGIALTIYADDVTMSFTKAFGSLEEAKAYSSEIINFVKQEVNKAGFLINHKKTKIMRPHNRQWVCGAVVNARVNMRKTERLALRALVHNCSKNGIEAEAAKTGMKPDNFIRKYAGRINWLCQLNPDAGIAMKLAFKKAAQPFLKTNPEIEIPELSWNSSIEMPITQQDLQEAEAGFKGDFEVKTETSTPRISIPIT